ncbi:MAG: hypothetical protein KGP10_05195 [Actinomycetales bacterium]|nr:hypothetical protein [Actinomycetales bacterium]
MKIPFLTGSAGNVTATHTGRPTPAHEIESTFSRGRCRFVLECTCGAHHDTPFIDEALNWWDSHRVLAGAR